MSVPLLHSCLSLAFLYTGVFQFLFIFVYIMQLTLLETIDIDKNPRQYKILAKAPDCS